MKNIDKLVLQAILSHGVSVAQARQAVSLNIYDNVRMLLPWWRRWRFNYGTLYLSLLRLVQAGLIEAKTDKTTTGRLGHRVYYEACKAPPAKLWSNHLLERKPEC